MKPKDIHYELNEAVTLQYDQNVCNLYLMNNDIYTC